MLPRCGGTVTRKKSNAWKSGLLATSGLAATFFAAKLLWLQGYPEWAFVLAFAAVWALISISWSNIDYAEESGCILARIVDRNFDHVYDRLEHLENEVEQLKARLDRPFRKAS